MGSVCEWYGKAGFNPQVELYQRLKMCPWMSPCLTLSIIS